MCVCVVWSRGRHGRVATHSRGRAASAAALWPLRRERVALATPKIGRVTRVDGATQRTASAAREHELRFPPRWPGAGAARGPEAKRLGGKPRGSAALSRRSGRAHRRDSRTPGRRCTGSNGLPFASGARRKRTRHAAPRLATTSASQPRSLCSRHSHLGHSRAGTRTRGRPEGGGVLGKAEAGGTPERRGVEGGACVAGAAAATTLAAREERNWFMAA